MLIGCCSRGGALLGFHLTADRTKERSGPSPEPLLSFCLHPRTVRHELSFDRYNEKAGRIFRLEKENVLHARVGYPWAPAIEAEVPEVETAVRFYRPFGSTLVAYGDRRFENDTVLYTDSTVFSVFTWPLLKGDPQSALSAPFAIVLTETGARKYFGEADPIGQVLRIDDPFDVQVTGILRDLPEASHLRFDALLSMETIRALDQAGQWRTPLIWGIFQYSTYLLLTDPGTAGSVEEKISTLLRREFGSDYRLGYSVRLEPITRIHLFSELPQELVPGGNILYVYLFCALALFILLLAAINYMNLATARAQERAREIGVRKVLGSARSHLVWQFLAEAVLLSLVALLMASLLLSLLLPRFNAVAGTRLFVSDLYTTPLIFAFIGVGLAVGLLSGSYPALYLSSVNPVHSRKGATDSGRKGSRLRKGLVVFQFTISVMMLVGVFTISHQIEFLRDTDLGFNRELLVTIPFRGSQTMQRQAELLKSQALQNPGIVAASLSHMMPGETPNSFAYLPEGSPPEAWVGLGNVAIDHDFFDTYQVEFVAGRDFASDRTSDSTAFVLNESAVRELGWASPQAAVGADLEWLLPGLGFKGPVIGVVRDFHFESLRSRIMPLVFNISRFGSSLLTVRLRHNELESSLVYLKQTWDGLEPAYPFHYAFVDDVLARQYEAEERLGQVFRVCAGLAIFIACLGLFGLAAFMTTRRTKEIGVRKVLGASVPNLLFLLSKDFVMLVLMAALVALPLAVVATSRWLDTFAYRTALEPLIFLKAVGLAIVVAVVSVRYQTMRAALANPVSNLRQE